MLAMLPSLSPLWLGILASLTDFFIRMGVPVAGEQ
jgi:hypothetical protein